MDPVTPLRSHPILRLLRLTLPFKWEITLAVLLGTATVGSGIGLMATSSYIISAAALHPSIAALEVAIVGVRFFGVSRGIFRYGERYVSHTVTFRLLARLRTWFYERLEPLAPARMQEFRTGDLLTRIVGDVETLQQFYVRVLAPPAVALLTTLGMWIFFATFDLRLANALVVFLVLAGVFVPLLTYALARSAGRRLITARGELETAALDGIQGMAELLAYGRADQQHERLACLNRVLVRAQAHLACVSALGRALLSFLTNTATLTVLILAIPLVTSGHLSGVLLATLALGAAASFEAVAPLPEALRHLASSREAAERLFAIVDAPPRVSDPAQPVAIPTQPALDVNGLRFRYAPDLPSALDDVSFTLRPGKLVAIVGPSGAGKSTLANLLLRFWDYDAGSICLGDRELRACAADDVRARIAVVPQQTHLFNGTIRQNLLIARSDATELKLDDAIRRAGLGAFLAGLPQSYETAVGEEGLLLSGGERQRVAIARALLKDSPLLLLDEPTANLDPVTERQVMCDLLDLGRDRATLLITHRLVGLSAADEILVLVGGRVVERGREDDLLRQRGIYHHLWRLQHQMLSSVTPDENAANEDVPQAFPANEHAPAASDRQIDAVMPM